MDPGIFKGSNFLQDKVIFSTCVYTIIINRQNTWSKRKKNVGNPYSSVDNTSKLDPGLSQILDTMIQCFFSFILLLKMFNV